MLVAALREDPTGQSVVLDAQRSAAGASAGASGFAAATMAASASGSGGSGSSEEARPTRLRRLLARLLPPNPFSSGAKAQAALKLAAWIAAVARDSEAGAYSIESRMVGAGDLPSGTLPSGSRQAVGAAADGLETGPAVSLLAASAASGLSMGQQQELLAAAAAAAAADGLGGLADDDTEDEDEMPQAAAERPQQKERRPHRQQRKRHKPLSELLAEIPLQEPLLPPADRLAAAAAAQQLQQRQPMMPTAAQLQQMLGGAGGLGLGAPEVLQETGGVGAGAPGSDTFGPAISLLLHQHLQQQGQGQHGAQLEQQMQLNEDALMLRALDAQVRIRPSAFRPPLQLTCVAMPCALSVSGSRGMSSLPPSTSYLMPVSAHPDPLPSAPRRACAPSSPHADEQPAAAERQQRTHAHGTGGRRPDTGRCRSCWCSVFRPGAPAWQL